MDNPASTTPEPAIATTTESDGIIHGEFCDLDWGGMQDDLAQLKETPSWQKITSIFGKHLTIPEFYPGPYIQLPALYRARWREFIVRVTPHLSREILDDDEAVIHALKTPWPVDGFAQEIVRIMGVAEDHPLATALLDAEIEALSVEEEEKDHSTPDYAGLGAPSEYEDPLSSHRTSRLIDIPAGRAIASGYSPHEPRIDAILPAPAACSVNEPKPRPPGKEKRDSRYPWQRTSAGSTGDPYTTVAQAILAARGIEGEQAAKLLAEPAPESVRQR